MQKEKIPLILASQSPRRKKLLEQIGFSFKVVPSEIDEVIDPTLSPAENAKQLSLKKALSVMSKIKNGIIVGADTIVVYKNQILGKPASKSEAIKMLKMLSGKSHFVYTGLALVNAETKKYITDVVCTEVHFRKLKDEEIREYVKTGSPMDKAGAYGIQDDYGAVFVERINGCYYNVVGLPLAKFYLLMKKNIK